MSIAKLSKSLSSLLPINRLYLPFGEPARIANLLAIEMNRSLTARTGVRILDSRVGSLIRNDAPGTKTNLVW